MSKKTRIISVVILVLCMVFAMSSMTYAAKPIPTYDLTSTLDPDTGLVTYNVTWSNCKVAALSITVGRLGDAPAQETIYEQYYKKPPVKVEGAATASVVIPGYENTNGYVTGTDGYLSEYYEYTVWAQAADSKGNPVFSLHDFFDTVE